MTTKFDLVAIGEPLVVMIPDRPGPLRFAPRFERAMAGAECNALLGLARLGGRAGLISRVGHDEFGAFVLETLRGASVDTSRVVVDPTRRTGIYFKEELALDGQAHPTYYREGSATSALVADDIDAGYIAQSRALLVTGISALLSDNAYGAVTHALQIARSAGVMTLFDPNLRSGLWGSERARELLCPLLEYVDIFLGGEREARVLLDGDASWSTRELVEKLAAAGPVEVVLKRGAEGAAMLDATGAFFEQPVFRTTVKSAVGAGDAFNAGFLHARQRGDDPQVALRVGAICGAAVCAGTGDFETFPRESDLAAYLESTER
ncbi:sugar kinase [Sphaerisporangium sp. NPDC088356]|uniref:sugar kinase n=1 Tax=Sphaerisporangium sp. NPDC088356 TaxID=3154871 RepID=UPI003431E243